MTYEMLHEWEEHVPDEGHKIHVDNPKRLGYKSEIDILARRPDHPIKLKF